MAQELKQALDTIMRPGFGGDGRLTAPAFPTEAQIDFAAQHLRESLQGHKMLTPWSMTPKAKKKKWLALAEGTLRAALKEAGDG